MAPPTAIGKSTVACIQAGAVFGFAGQVDGIVRRIWAELGGPCPTIATGGLAGLVCRTPTPSTATSRCSRSTACG